MKIDWHQIWKDFEQKFIENDKLHDRPWRGRHGQHNILREVLATNGFYFSTNEWIFIANEYETLYNTKLIWTAEQGWAVSKEILTDLIERILIKS